MDTDIEIQIEQKPVAHKELVKRAVLWLRNKKNCSVVMAELRTQNTETPEA
jgi:hypothetical protein